MTTNCMACGKPMGDETGTTDSKPIHLRCYMGDAPMTNRCDEIAARVAAIDNAGSSKEYTEARHNLIAYADDDLRYLLDQHDADQLRIAALEAALEEIQELPSVDFDLASGIARRALAASKEQRDA